MKSCYINKTIKSILCPLLLCGSLFPMAHSYAVGPNINPSAMSQRVSQAYASAKTAIGQGINQLNSRFRPSPTSPKVPPSTIAGHSSTSAPSTSTGHSSTSTPSSGLDTAKKSVVGENPQDNATTLLQNQQKQHNTLMKVTAGTAVASTAAAVGALLPGWYQGGRAVKMMKEQQDMSAEDRKNQWEQLTKANTELDNYIKKSKESSVG